MRVAFLTRSLRLDDGWGRYSRRLIEQMPDLGVEPMALVARGSEAAGLDPRIRVDPCLPEGEDLGLLRLACSAAALRKRLAGFDVIHCLVEPYAPLAGLLALGRRLFVMGVGTYLTRPLETGRQRRRHAWAYRRAEGILCISAYTRDRLLRSLPELRRTRVVPLGVEPGLVAEAPPEPPPRPTILSVGALKERKGYLFSVSAFARVRERFPTARYVIIGRADDRSYTARVRALADELGIGDAVEILHDVDDAALRHWYRRATFFVLASLNAGDAYEGFGLVHLEASAAGIPTIGSAGCGNEQAIRDGETGLLTHQGDADALAGAMLRLLGDGELRRRMGEAGIRHAREHGWDRVSRRVVESYASMAENT